MDNAIKLVNSFVSGLSSIFDGLLGLGVVAGLVFGDVAVIGGVVDNITALVSGLGDQGLVGLIVSIILIKLLDIK